MARNLEDVLHHLIPDVDEAREETKPDDELPAADRFPIVAVPLGERDVVRAAFVWNLAVELARLGASAAVIAADSETREALWPAPGAGPLGAELVLSGARSLGELGATAREIAGERQLGKDGLVLVCVPLAWLGSARSNDPLLRWSLLFATPDARELRQAYGLVEQLRRSSPAARVGVTIHGVESIRAARQAFGWLARTSERELGLGLESYGLLVDDLHVYRAIVSLRPLGLAHPQSRGARALRDVARLLLEDARVESA